MEVHKKLIEPHHTKWKKMLMEVHYPVGSQNNPNFSFVNRIIGFLLCCRVSKERRIGLSASVLRFQSRM
jgi:hypothetical protein